MFLDDILLLNSESDRVSTTRRPGYTLYSERMASSKFQGLRIEEGTLRMRNESRGTPNLKELMTILAGKDMAAYEEYKAKYLADG
mmetsp:Transcript_19881/g.30616  ORF Transcript_19881/g.30616 Transcript_19881/m.30616 type:complete len:85 (+) Transcript_19881:237-491(+)